MPITPTLSQYATAAQIQLLALAPAKYADFEAKSPGCVVAAIQAASADADSYLASQFVLPLVQWDMALARAVCRMAAKSLYDMFGYNPNAPIDRQILASNDMAMAWLEKISTNSLSPPYVDSSASAPSAGAFIVSEPTIGFTSTSNNTCSPWPYDDGCY